MSDDKLELVARLAVLLGDLVTMPPSEGRLREIFHAVNDLKAMGVLADKVDKDE